MQKPALFGRTKDELTDITRSLGLPAFAGRQLAEWLYRNRAESFDDMTNLSKAARTALSENYSLGITPPVSVAESVDGTKKYLFSSAAGSGTGKGPAGGDAPDTTPGKTVPESVTRDSGPALSGRAVETAWIPEEKRGTLCVSTQIGCRRGCRFCMTARQGFQGNLSAGEILNQYRSLPESGQVTHFVFMGMGEPLDNPDAVISTIEILTADWGFGFSPRKITVSTIGILDALPRLLEETDCRLALSLHSPFPDRRAELMPYERRYPMTEILETFRQAELNHRRLTIEYLMIDGINDRKEDSKELARILEGMGARVNLIPYHPIPDFPGTPTPMDRIEAFRDDLKRRGQIATIRKSRGLDIDAACGLLSTKRRAAE